jgi:lipoprotein-releasing system permease protein
VAILLIFVILYVIVVQKTRDIGVLKAVGASNLGVAGIFLTYGAAIGMIGSIIGTVAGCYFVWNINPIADWIANTTGFTPWNRETFMFEKIPDQVDFGTAIWIVGGAIIAGVFGALLPAVIAAMRQPVEALRYE